MKRNPKPDLSLVPEIDWARLAAYIDGEGHIAIATQVHKPPFEGRGRYGYVSLAVSNTDPRMTDWMLKNFGGSIQVRKTHSTRSGRQQRWKPCFNWIIANARAAEILGKALPYFLIKREQAEIAIVFQSTMCRSGRRGTPEAVLNHRADLKTKLRALTARGPQTVAVAS